jgi:hypothetical protein
VTTAHIDTLTDYCLCHFLHLDPNHQLVKVRQKLGPLITEQNVLTGSIRELQMQIDSKIREQELEVMDDKPRVLPSLVQAQFEDRICPVTGDPFIGGGELGLFPCGCEISRAGAEDWLVYGRYDSAYLVVCVYYTCNCWYDT